MTDERIDESLEHYVHGEPTDRPDAPPATRDERPWTHDDDLELEAVAMTVEQEGWDERGRRVRRALAELQRLRRRAEVAEAGLSESDWTVGGVNDDPPEVKLAWVRTLAERLLDWCRDDKAEVQIVGNIALDLFRVLDGDGGEKGGGEQ